MSAYDHQPPSQPPSGGAPNGPYLAGGPLPPTTQAYQQAPAGYGYGYPASMEANALGSWALGLGIASFVLLGIFLSIPAVILGHKGMRAADEGRATNRGIAQAGFILGIINIVLFVVGVGLLVLFLVLAGAASVDAGSGVV